MSRAAARSLRLFVAVYPPASVAAALREGLAGLELPDQRLVPREQIHMTLHFIGDTPADEVEATTETVRRAAGGLAPCSPTP